MKQKKVNLIQRDISLFLIYFSTSSLSSDDKVNYIYILDASQVHLLGSNHKERDKTL